jgi:DNA (cytosine-5)-methyltransferase 1
LTGGLDLAAEWAGFETVGQCEFNPYATKVLEKHWPDVLRWRDVRDVTGEAIAERGIKNITVLSGGFPCQPHSLAGKRMASSDERDLWGEFARLIFQTRSRWVVGENVAGLLSSESGRFFGRVLRDLAGMGYYVGWCCVPAYAVGSPYSRARVFIVASTYRNGLQRVLFKSRKIDETHQIQRPPSENIRAAISLWSGEETDCRGIRTDNGVSNWMDRVKSCGNCVNPYQAYPIFQAIAEIESGVVE